MPALIGGVLVGGSLMPLLGWPALPPTSHVAAPVRSVNLGLFDTEAPVRHRFRFQNVGTADLEVHRVETSCGCTAAVLSATRIPPGGEGVVEVTVQLEPGGRGFFSEAATLHTNDPRHPRAAFSLSGQVMRVFAVEPTVVKIAALPVVVAIESPLGRPFTVLHALTSVPTVGVDEIRSPDGLVWFVKLSRRADVLPGVGDVGEVVIQTNSPFKPWLTVPLQ